MNTFILPFIQNQSVKTLVYHVLCTGPLKQAKAERPSKGGLWPSHQEIRYASSSDSSLLMGLPRPFHYVDL